MLNDHIFFKVGREMQEFKRHEDFFTEQGFLALPVEEILRIAHLTVWDAYGIFDEAKRIPDGGTYLEIGSANGGSLLVAYSGTQCSGCSVKFKVLEVEIHPRLLVAAKQVPRLKIINNLSALVKDQIQDSSVDLLFIDGDHRYPFVKEDIKNYWPKVKEGGVLLGHDYKRVESVRQAVDELLPKMTILKNSDIWKVRK